MFNRQMADASSVDEDVLSYVLCLCDILMVSLQADEKFALIYR